MQAGKLDSKITIKRLVKSDDGFGGFTSALETIATVWCNLSELSGEINAKFGKRQQDLEVEILMRKNTADLIEIGDIFTVEGKTKTYRINNKFEFDLDHFTKLVANAN